MCNRGESVKKNRAPLQVRALIGKQIQKNDEGCVRARAGEKKRKKKEKQRKNK